MAEHKLKYNIDQEFETYSYICVRSICGFDLSGIRHHSVINSSNRAR
jgi:hypothetical protein